METRELVTRADANYYQAWRLLTGSVETGEVREKSGVLAAITGVPIPAFNIAFITRPLGQPRKVLAEAISWFDARKLPFLVRARIGLDEASETGCRDLGLEYQDSLPGMTMYPLGRVPEPPGQLQVVEVRDETALDAMVSVCARGFEMDEAPVRALVPPLLLDMPDLALYLGFVDGRPVTTSGLVLSHATAGIVQVSTLPEARNQGLGAAMTWHAVGEGQKRGARLASLQASTMGFPVYEKMGFRQTQAYATYMRPGGEA
jgi:ribosomal protein S18 acetylase RimI-like enzyme